MSLLVHSFVFTEMPQDTGNVFRCLPRWNWKPIITSKTRLSLQPFFEAKTRPAIRGPRADVYICLPTYVYKYVCILTIFMCMFIITLYVFTSTSIYIFQTFHRNEIFCRRPECNSPHLRLQLDVAQGIVHVHGNDHVDVLDDLSWSGLADWIYSLHHARIQHCSMISIIEAKLFCRKPSPCDSRHVLYLYWNDCWRVPA